MLIPQSLDTQWYERAAECANETVILSGGRVAFMEPDVTLGWLRSISTQVEDVGGLPRILSERWSLHE
jgi:hypothetical protein